MLARFLTLGSCALILFSLSGVLATSALAVVDVYAFDTDSQRERYLQLSEELRCPKCQNQNLAGSDSQIAGDLRRELRRLLGEGKTDREIKLFMVDRYGEFVLYNPPLQKSTLVLWGLPFLLFLTGVIAVFVLVKRRKASKEGASSGDSLSAEERQVLDDLLDKKP
jgi:cytochrome c-type biogenesis protein CcmH